LRQCAVVGTKRRRDRAQIAELSRTGKYSQAIPLAQRLLADMEKAHGPDHRDVAASRNNLADLYERQSRFAGAEPLYRRALAIREQAAGPDHPETVVEALIKDRHALLMVPAGPLTALPFHLLVTEKPAAAIPEKMDGYRDAAWLIKRLAIDVLPSVTSLKALRAFTQHDQAVKPMIGFGDPLFNPTQDAPGDKRAAAPPGTIQSAARSVTTAAYTDFWQGAGVDWAKLAQALPQLPDTADELNAVAKDLGVAASDIHLGADASETTVKRAPLADYRIVYFATHGLVAGDVKGLAEPSLVLSIPRQPSDLDDGLLTASEGLAR
jgi:CHAT domain-containing protein